MRLLTKIWLSTSLVITALAVVTGWTVSQHVVRQTERQLTAEVASGLHAYRSLWRERAQMLETVSAHIASAPQVRAAFGTGDAATIADTSGELLGGLERQLGERALVVVADPRDKVIARLAAGAAVPDQLAFADYARRKFPAPLSGFSLLGGRLYQLVVTPVYVQSGAGLALLNVLITGFEVTDAVAAQLRLATGSEFVFAAGGHVLASTLGPRAAPLLPLLGRRSSGQPETLSAPAFDYIALEEPLADVEGRSVGTLAVLRSLEAARAGYTALRRDIAALWAVSLAVSFLVTFVLARRITRPIVALDHAAAEVARENYDYRVEPITNDEVGRLARTFNHMCASIQQARQELIRNERLYTVGRLASSIVHDLRNPLAAIYGSSEMLLQADLPEHQQKRLSSNLYKASRKIQGMLDDLLKISRGKTSAEREETPLAEILEGAIEPLRAQAEAQRVGIDCQVPADVMVPADRGRLERAFSNLLANALDVMPAGGLIAIETRTDSGSLLVSVRDTGPGIHPDVRDRLFQPFASAGKKNGTGLGLALARQTVLDHDGDMWAESQPGQGATFYVRLPLVTSPVPVGQP